MADLDLISYCDALSQAQRVSWDSLQSSSHAVFFTALSQHIDSQEPRQLLWHVQHQQHDQQLCVCGMPVAWVRNQRNYRKHCSPSCAGSHKTKTKTTAEKHTPWHRDPTRRAEVKQLRMERSMAKHGVPHHAQLSSVRAKTAATNTARYGGTGAAASVQVRDRYRQTMQSRYGVDNPSQMADVQARKLQTNRQRYGHDHPFKSAEVRARQQQTMLAQWGVAHALQSGQIKHKQQTTNLTRYGHVSALGSGAVRQAMIHSMQSVHGVDYASQQQLGSATMRLLNDADAFAATVADRTLQEICQLLDVSLRTVLNYAAKHGVRDLIAPVKVSSYEQKIAGLLDSLGVQYQRNTRKVIAPWELDFHIPSHGLAIEVGSAYWHCEVSAGKDRHYHLDKWQRCRDINITLLQYFDADIVQHWPVVASKISRMLGKSQPRTGARLLCLSVMDDYAAESQFLSVNHLQGPSSNRNLVIAAHHKDQLVGISTWLIQGHRAELVRYATDVCRSFPGLFSRMLSRFVKESAFTGQLISFSDNRHSNGALYQRMGFDLQHVTAAGYAYTKDYLTFESRIKYQKHKLAKLFQLDHEAVSVSSEWEIMQNQGYDRIWDAGQSKWTLDIKPQLASHIGNCSA